MKRTSALLLTIAAVATAMAHEGRHVPADRRAEAPAVTVEIRDGDRIIRANGIPEHGVGRFPNRGNPNRIAPQRHEYRVPVKPTRSDRRRPAMGMPFGVALNGVPFDPGAAEWWRGDHDWQYEPLGGAVDLGLDANHAHVQPTGSYHYHGLPTGLLEARKSDDRPMTLLGYAADGYPIYGPLGPSDAADIESEPKRLTSSYRLRKGTRPDGRDGPGGVYDGSFVQDWEHVAGAGDLDEFNGRVGPTPEYPEGTFHYIITDDFPLIPRLFRGEPDASFERRRPGPGGPPGSGRRGPPGRRPPPRRPG